ASEASANALTNALIGTAGQSPCISSGSRAANVQTNRVLDPVLGRHELHDIYNVLPIRPGYRVAGSIATYENRLLLNTVIFEPGGNAIARHLLAGEPGEDESALFARFAKGLTARLSCPASESEEAQRTL
ncbi:MAG: hypothetical protein KDH09_14515, partial [Chrysiogenetes bacterium]|nr:hypothetical protein [Chrysiogenetes bacterium]